MPSRKNRTLYIVLGLFFGSFGLHNFYAGQYVRAAVKLTVFVVTITLWASFGASEPAWLIPLFLGGAMILFDFLFDPDQPLIKDGRVCGLSRSVFALAYFAGMWVAAGVIGALLAMSGALK